MGPTQRTNPVRTLDDLEVGPALYLGLAYLTMHDGEHLGCSFRIAKDM